MSTLVSTASIDESYTAAYDAAIVVDQSDLGYLRFTGETRLDLINRMSTQKLVDLVSGQGAATVLTTDIGRIIDRIILYAADDAVDCLTGPQNGNNVASYLRRFVFFMDDFQVEDLSQQTAVLGVYGRRSQDILASRFEVDLDLPLHHWTKTTINNAPVSVHRTDPIAGDGFFILSDAAEKDRIQVFLLEARVTPAGQEALEYLRIEAGQPRLGRELTSDYIPLEAGLWDDVSFNKGCYTGQEIIARMESRGRLAKKLALFQLESLVEPGTEVISHERTVGSITSAAAGPVGVRALGYVKTSALEEGGPFRVGSLPVINLKPLF